MAESRYQPVRWPHPSRFVVVRRPQPDEPTEQLTLFKLGKYHYQVLVTNLPLQPLNLWRFYNDRAGVELLIKQLKGDYALGSIAAPPLLRQRHLLPSAPAGLQLDELVQTALPAARVSAGHVAERASADPPDARSASAHPQPASLGHARERTAGGRLDLCLAPDQRDSRREMVTFHAGFRFNHIVEAPEQCVVEYLGVIRCSHDQAVRLIVLDHLEETI